MVFATGQKERVISTDEILANTIQATYSSADKRCTLFCKQNDGKLYRLTFKQ